MNAYNSAKSMAVVCFLVEVAGKAEAGGVPEVRRLACERIHRMFANEPMVARLVHYYVSLIPCSDLTEME